jgi:hypothetical protein
MFRPSQDELDEHENTSRIIATFPTLEEAEERKAKYVKDKELIEAQGTDNYMHEQPTYNEEEGEYFDEDWDYEQGAERFHLKINSSLLIMPANSGTTLSDKKKRKMKRQSVFEREHTGAAAR